MRRLLLAFALSCTVTPPASAHLPADPDDIVVAETLLGVADPHAFVAATYARYLANPNVPPANISSSYSPRLRRLFDAYEACRDSTRIWSARWTSTGGPTRRTIRSRTSC